MSQKPPPKPSVQISDDDNDHRPLPLYRPEESSLPPTLKRSQKAAPSDTSKRVVFDPSIPHKEGKKPTATYTTKGGPSFTDVVGNARTQTQEEKANERAMEDKIAQRIQNQRLKAKIDHGRSSHSRSKDSEALDIAQLFGDAPTTITPTFAPIGKSSLFAKRAAKANQSGPSMS